jgi:molybdate/tungstate transport system ATP-binding protein
MFQVKNINKSFNSFALNDISFEINPNDYLVVLGPSGSGKTVLLEILAGLNKQDTGTISLKNQNISFLSPEKRNIGLLYQNYMLFDHMTVWENIQFSLKIKKQDKHQISQHIADIASLLKINHILQRYPQNLSGGEKQRCALARALVMQPDILLLDEPFTSIDAHLKKRVIQHIKELHQKLGLTIIQVTHDIDEALFLANKIAIMHQGAIIQQGIKENVFRNPCNRFVADFLGYKNIFSGEFTDAATFRINGLNIHLDKSSHHEKKAYLLIPPESIIISKQVPNTSARNHFSGEIRHIIMRNGFYEVIIDLGILLSVYVTCESVSALKLHKKSKINIIFKATAMRIF